MAYEVIKTIRGREYRYEVRSERDPATGKTRNRWTYLGRVGTPAAPDRARARRPNARLRLLEAAERLLESGDARAVTADAIAVAAGVAHGTFYRYFRDRCDALEALARHLKETGSLVDDVQLRDDVASEDAARAAVRGWIVARLTKAHERRASVRAWYALIASDARLAAFREERRESMARRVREHIEALNRSGCAAVAEPAATAAILMALYEGLIRTAILDGDGLTAPAISAAADAFERTIFARF